MNVRSRKKSVKHVTFKTEREMAAWMAKQISKAKKEVIIVCGDEELSAKEISSLKRAQKDVKAGRITRFTYGEVR